MKHWLRQQQYALAGAWYHIRQPRGGFVLNLIVIAIALMLPLSGLTLLENVRPVSEKLVVEPEISVFLAPDTSRDKASALAPQLRRLLTSAGMEAKVEFIPREKALSVLDAKTGVSSIVATLGSNPLPDSYVLKLAAFSTVSEVNKTEGLLTQLQALPHVEHVQLDSSWVKRLSAVLEVLRLALLLLAVTLGTVVVAVVFNTIRLQVLHQREEIEISKLVGASNSFIYRPFYYAGAFLGLAAALVALGLVTLALHPLNQALAHVVQLYGSEFRLVPLGLASTGFFLAASATLGWLGALLSVRRTVHQAS